MRSTWGRSRRVPTRCVDVVAAVRAGVDLLLCAADPVAIERIERTLVQAADRGLFDAAEVDATERRVAALRSWLGVGRCRAGPCGRRWRRASGARRGARRAFDHAGARSGRAPAGSLGRAPPHPRGHAPPDRPDAGRHLIDGRARPRGRPPPLPCRRGRGGGRTRTERGRRSPRSATGRRPRISQSSAPSTGIGSDRSSIWSRRSPSTGTPTIAVAMRGPWDVAAYPAGVTALATYSILPGSLDGAGRGPRRRGWCARPPPGHRGARGRPGRCLTSRPPDTRPGSLGRGLRLVAALADCSRC